jgi:hypothetical protein
VDYLQIQDNAINFPAAFDNPNKITGNGTWQNAVSITLTNRHATEAQDYYVRYHCYAHIGWFMDVHDTLNVRVVEGSTPVKTFTGITSGNGQSTKSGLTFGYRGVIAANTSLTITIQLNMGLSLSYAKEHFLDGYIYLK